MQVRPDTKGIELKDAWVECLKCIVWCRKNDPSEEDVFWEDLAIMLNDVEFDGGIQ